MPVKYILDGNDKIDFGAVGLKNATGQAGKLLKVKSTEDLLEYLSQGAGGGLDADLLDGLHGSAYEQVANKGVANGYPSLDPSGKVPSSQLPALALTDVWTVASEAEQLALNAQEGDIAIRTDLNKSFAHNGGTSGTMADWSELLSPTGAVLSVFGRTGAVVAQANDYTWAQIDKTTSSLADITTKSHTVLSDIGTNTHATIDSQLPSAGEKSALAGTSGTPGAGNKYVTDADPRNTNARTPTSHASTHERGGSDKVKAAGLWTGLDADKPGTGNAEGDTWWATDTDKLYIWDGAAWKEMGTGGGASTFLGLTDTPSSYTGQALRFTRVNAGETALEFIDHNVASGIHGITGSVVGTTDTQTLLSKLLQSPKIKDVDATPVDDVTLKVLGGLLKIRNSADTADVRLEKGFLPSDTEYTANKNIANGYAGLDINALIALAQIPATLTGKDADTIDTFHASALEKVANKDQANGYPGLSASSKIAGTQITYGTGANTACEGNDSRLSDARTPTAHATSHERGGSDIVKASRFYSGLNADKPGTGNTEGDIWWATDTDKLYVWNGSNWQDVGLGTGASDFLGLTDTPDSYTGQAKKMVRVNAGATGLEFLNELDTLLVTPTTFAQVGIGVTSSSTMFNVEGDSTTFGGIFRLKDTRATPGGQSVMVFLNSTETIFYLDNYGDLGCDGWLKWGEGDPAKYGRLAKPSTDGFLGLTAQGSDADINVAIIAKGAGLVKLGGTAAGPNIEVDNAGYLKFVSVSSLPTAGSTYRGMIARTTNGAADRLNVCRKKNNGAFEWTDVGVFSTRVVADRTAAQAISDSTFTKIQLNNEVVDNDDDFDPTSYYRFTAPIAGGYLITAYVDWQDNGSGMRRLAFYKNGLATSISEAGSPAPAGTDTRQNIAHILQLSANDYIELYCYQTSGAGLNINEAGLSVYRLW